MSTGNRQTDCLGAVIDRGREGWDTHCGVLELEEVIQNLNNRITTLELIIREYTEQK